MSESENAAAPAVDRLSALPKPETPVGVRERLTELLRRDLVGPHPDLDPDLAREVLTGTNPSNWYLTGYLGPQRKSALAKRKALADGSDATEEEQAELALESQRGSEGMEQGAPGRVGESDDGSAERPPVRSFEPASLGLTVLLPLNAKSLKARVTWGDYVTEPRLDEAVFLADAREQAEAAGEKPKAPAKSSLSWRRIPREEWVTVDLPAKGGRREIVVPNSASPMAPGGGLQIVVSARQTRTASIDGKKRDLLAVSVFLVNARAETLRRFGDIAMCFQARLELQFDSGFESRDDRASYDADDFDERLADLHYRDVCSYAVGHNTSGDWVAADEDGKVTAVFTNPLPQQEVEKLGADIEEPGVVRGMEALAEASGDAGALRDALSALPRAYLVWAEAQAKVEVEGKRRQEIARKCLEDVQFARKRIEGGIALLQRDPTSRQAFQIMNRVMARANRQRSSTLNGEQPENQKEPTWRLFQLAFMLLNLEGLTDPTHSDRPVVDLLFFPTGGGKTEAYLGLAAYSIARRRLANPGHAGAGLSVVMRYTLRLLTLDQLARAAGLVCALELERKTDIRLGEWPIEIGLWVGGAASPNNLGSSQNKKPNTAVYWLEEHRRGRGAAPAPLKTCPWCGSPFDKDSFRLHPTSAMPQRLDIRCPGLECPFSGQDRLPIVVVDEEIYRRLPAFMIATVDKFANVPWEGRTGAFFGHVDRRDDLGFYGAAEPSGGVPLEAELRPIDLIIQDELHLISGPLGTIAGLYETAFDLLASRLINGQQRGPKIVASTATVRRADSQIRNLFGRDRTAIFPPPGVNRDDSFFARGDKETPSRLYLGIASPGRGPKLVFLRTLQTLLSGSQALSKADKNDPADPYLTALCYFNALRELGGARRIVDDEVRAHLTNYGTSRVRGEPAGAPFNNRKLREIQELTSRYSTDQVAEARARLSLATKDKNGVDVALATNMISVGLDIGRLGLMVVQGQPKTAAEYIQATSRVGREGAKPGLVVTLLNIHKPRDRTHYEQFRAFHMSFYRAVEATSVTPFAPRALDRALAAILVAGVRHCEPGLTPNNAADRIAENGEAYQRVRGAVSRKMETARHDTEAVERCLARMDELREAWADIAEKQTRNGDNFTYGSEDPVRRLLQVQFEQRPNMEAIREWFVAGRSMRDTEPVALLKIRGPGGQPFQ
jgi:hypothetical protein